MKLQVAIDRVTLDDAVKLTHELDGVVDIIELGTSLIKDYGLLALKDAPFNIHNSRVLYDLKTNDEGAYEFEKGFESNADILTVMAGSSLDTIKQVYDVTEKYNKEMLIDLLEVDNNKIKDITSFDNAIYGLHHSKDSKDSFDAVDTLDKFKKSFPEVKKIAVAGGIDLKQAKAISAQGIANTIIVGGKIVKTDNPVESAKQFMEAIK
ncbi:orotidine 5'-phosphate decarboxylase [Companilactobacillus allii]|uniref:3-hexulose-6-phosphate synthase n=1 Tax=Companilactobacillus allii TaxID=1847728 RepID=A0A1P8Q1R0_9LACO|nr:orotidine 5'-phosphate decarboxylase / HUMPS family protein [Companilactobacillus allii]APX71813.1 3-hexulose-6-phosphate synthase [Companilactobacillus allii]USQ68900.1 orotidine 5'-phosphate decarboxylase [Companilactobacillus allii]